MLENKIVYLVFL